MDKIDRKEYEGRFDKGSLLGKQLDKLDELVEKANEMEARIDSIWAHRKRMRIIEERK